MGRKRKKSVGTGVGRPKKLYGSRDKTKCCVSNCGFTMRNDKVMDHQARLVLFNEDGKPATEENADFRNLTEAQKTHTLYFRSVGATETNFPKNIFVESSKKMPGHSIMTKFVFLLHRICLRCIILC